MDAMIFLLKKNAVFFTGVCSLSVHYTNYLDMFGYENYFDKTKALSGGKRMERWGKRFSLKEFSLGGECYCLKLWDGFVLRLNFITACPPFAKHISF